MSSGGGGTNTIEKATPTKEERLLQAESLKQQQFATSQFQQVNEQFSNPDNAAKFFPGQTFADLNQQQLGALAQQGNVANQQAQTLPGLTNQALDFGLNQSVNPASNPFFQGNINATLQPVTDQFLNQVLPELGSAAQQAGAFGGSRQGQIEAFAANDYLRTIGGLANQLGAQQFQSGQDTFSRTLALLPQTLQTQFLPGQTQGAIGDIFQQQTQLGLGEDVARFNFDQNSRSNQLIQAGGLLPGGTVVTGLGGSESSSSGPSPNKAVGALGGAATGAGIGGSVGGPVGAAWGAALGGLVGLFS